MRDKIKEIASKIPATQIEFAVTSKAPMAIGGHTSTETFRGPAAATRASATAMQRIKEGYSDVQIHEKQVVVLSLSKLPYTEKLQYAKQISEEMGKRHIVDTDIHLWTVEDVDWFLANYGQSYIQMSFVD